MNALILLVGLILCGVISFLSPEYGPMAVIVCLVTASVGVLAISQVQEERKFMVQLFFGALFVRMFVGTLIFYFRLQDFFGGDAFQYDLFGYALLKSWEGDPYYRGLINLFNGEGSGGGWGMLYMVAIVYKLIGRNMLAIQFINATMGAATAPIIGLTAMHIFRNRRVTRISALFAAFYPSLILWSSQGLKDGPIVFMLALAILATLKLGERISLNYFVMLAVALLSLLSLRFYIFYMMVAAIVGSFFIGMRAMTAVSFTRQFLIIIIMGLTLTYVGVTRYASAQFDTFGSMDAIQRSHLDAARSGQSGFGKDVDVSSTSGALSLLPIGLLYLLFAPFPWQLANLRQSITLPEMIVWWVSVPLLVLGLWFTIRYKLRQVSPILIFTTMLTLVYSLFQGNIGTAYRQRSQLLVFYFIFVAVGYMLLKEQREEKARRAQALREEASARATAFRPKPYVWNDKPQKGAQVEKDQPQVEGGKIQGA